jgi:dolichol-phosphate mannosyltransferase
VTNQLTYNWAVIIPMANEEDSFAALIHQLKKVLDEQQSGTVYIVVDRVSTDNTLALCHQLSYADARFITVWKPENKNVVDAYLAGYRAAFENGHEVMIEMDAGLSHHPDAIPHFLYMLQSGYECVFGSRFISGGSIKNANAKRLFLSKYGTTISNLLLGTHLYDMTSGYQGLQRHIVQSLMSYPLKSTGHFYQTEVRYLLRHKKQVEVPIHYQSPSPRVSFGSILNSINTLCYYFMRRLLLKSIQL